MAGPDTFIRYHFNPSPFLPRLKLLTRRQLTCLIGIAMGKTQAEIGHDLGVSQKTIGYHCHWLYRTLGVSKPRETRGARLTRIAVAGGLVEL